VRSARAAAVPLALAALAACGAAWGQAADPFAVASTTPGPGGTQTWSITLQTLLLLTSLTLLPAVVLMMTGFTRIIIVLSLLRQALGVPTAPPNQVLLGLALFLTFFVMAPVFDRVYEEAYLPFSQQRISAAQALERGAEPLKQFMLKQTRQSDLALFVRIARVEPVAEPKDIPLRVLLPAFVTSELKTAFQIGFLVFIPFLIIDMMVSSILMSMGMMMLSPVIISLPFKLMLFVLVDGWHLLIGSLVQSFVP
jgi:flagellar biosynthesis protein FliP